MKHLYLDTFFSHIVQPELLLLLMLTIFYCHTALSLHHPGVTQAQMRDGFS